MQDYSVSGCMLILSSCEDEEIKSLRDCCFTHIVVNGETPFLRDTLLGLVIKHQKKTGVVPEDIIEFAKNHSFSIVAREFFKGNKNKTEEFLKMHNVPYKRINTKKRDDFDEIKEFAPLHTREEVAQKFFKNKIKTAREYLRVWGITYKGAVCGRKPKNHEI